MYEVFIVDVSYIIKVVIRVRIKYIGCFVNVFKLVVWIYCFFWCEVICWINIYCVVVIGVYVF